MAKIAYGYMLINKCITQMLHLERKIIKELAILCRPHVELSNHLNERRQYLACLWRYNYVKGCAPSFGMAWL